MTLKHKCFKQVNKQLAESNTELNFNLIGIDQVFIETSTKTKKRGSKPVKMIASYCPFCGDKLKDV